MSESAEEHKLLYMLGTFNPKLGTDCVRQTRRCADCSQMREVVKPQMIGARKTGEPIAFRIQLKTPYYFALSHPLTRFRKGEDYHIGSEETGFCTTLGMIPAFMINLNRFTLLKFWGEMARQLFSPTAEPFLEGDYAFWKLLPKTGRFPELSSMNFVLRQNGEFVSYEAKTREILKDYFTFGFWAFPRNGFSDSTVIINDGEQVHTVLKSSKSLYIPGKPTYVPMDLGREKNVEVKVLPLLELLRTQSGYDLQRLDRVVLTRGIADSLEAEQHRGQVFVNGVTADFIRRSTQFTLLTAVDLYEVSNYELFMSVIGIIMMDRFYEGKSFSHIGTVDEIRIETARIMKLLLSRSYLDKTIGDSLDQFSTALSYLRPILTVNDEDIMYMHPSVLIAFLENGYDSLINREEDLCNALRLLDMMPNQQPAEILRSDESTYLRRKGYFPERILMSLRPALEQMYLSRILRNPPIPSSVESTTEDTSDSASTEDLRGSIRIGEGSRIDVGSKEQQEFLDELKERNKRLKETERQSE